MTKIAEQTIDKLREEIQSSKGTEELRLSDELRAELAEVPESLWRDLFEIDE